MLQLLLHTQYVGKHQHWTLRQNLFKFMYGSLRFGPSEEGCMFEDSPPICGVQPTRPWPFEEQTREPASMGLTPTVPRTISHRTTYRWKCRRWFLCRPRQWSVRPPISQHDASYGNARCDFHARHGRDLHIPFAHRATAGRHQKLPIKDRVETTRKCWGHRHLIPTEMVGQFSRKWFKSKMVAHHVVEVF